MHFFEIPRQRRVSAESIEPDQY